MVWWELLQPCSQLSTPSEPRPRTVAFLRMLAPPCVGRRARWGVGRFPLVQLGSDEPHMLGSVGWSSSAALLRRAAAGDCFKGLLFLSPAGSRGFSSSLWCGPRHPPLERLAPGLTR